jgi:hypothetical protein
LRFRQDADLLPAPAERGLGVDDGEALQTLLLPVGPETSRRNSDKLTGLHR